VESISPETTTNRNKTHRSPTSQETTLYGASGYVESQIENLILDFGDVSNVIRTNTDDLLAQC